MNNADFIIPVEIDGTIHQVTLPSHTSATQSQFESLPVVGAPGL